MRGRAPVSSNESPRPRPGRAEVGAEAEGETEAAAAAGVESAAKQHCAKRTSNPTKVMLSARTPRNGAQDVRGGGHNICE